jgi:hypothetical protein
MTTTVIEFKCPACGHLMGEEEYELASEKMKKIVQDTSNGQIEKIKSECEDKVLEAETKADNWILDLESQHKREL